MDSTVLKFPDMQYYLRFCQLANQKCWMKILCITHNQINPQSYNKLQSELSQIFSVAHGKTGGGQSSWGGQNKCWWVAADRDPQLFGKLLQIYESEK